MIHRTRALTAVLGVLVLFFILPGCGGEVSVEPVGTVPTDNGGTSSTGTGGTSSSGDTGGTPAAGSGGPVPTEAGAPSLAWDPPTTTVDGAPLTALAGYKIYYGAASGNYTASVDVKNVTSISLSTLDLQSGQTYYFAVTAYDAAGNESGYSNEVSKAWP